MRSLQILTYTKSDIINWLLVGFTAKLRNWIPKIMELCCFFQHAIRVESNYPHRYQSRDRTLYGSLIYSEGLNRGRKIYSLRACSRQTLAWHAERSVKSLSLNRLSVLLEVSSDFHSRPYVLVNIELVF